MKYRIIKENKPTLKNYGRYRAKAVHRETIDTKQILSETSQLLGITEGAVTAALSGLAEVTSRHLRNGQCVRLDGWGLLKLELLSKVVDSPETFNAKDDILGVRLHLLAESRHGQQALYEGIKLVREEE
jgi:hypothetical protein